MDSLKFLFVCCCCSFPNKNNFIDPFSSSSLYRLFVLLSYIQIYLFLNFYFFVVPPSMMMYGGCILRVCYNFMMFVFAAFLILRRLFLNNFFYFYFFRSCCCYLISSGCQIFEEVLTIRPKIIVYLHNEKKNFFFFIWKAYKCTKHVGFNAMQLIALKQQQQQQTKTIDSLRARVLMSWKVNRFTRVNCLKGPNIWNLWRFFQFKKFIS